MYRYAGPPRRPSAVVSSALRKRLAIMENLLTRQQEQIIRQEEEITQQHERIARQEEAMGLSGGSATGADSGTGVAAEMDALHTGLTSRRNLLRLGGVGVAAGAVVAVGTLAGGVPVARAAGGSGDGTGVIQGSGNVNTSSTGTILNPVAASSPVSLLTIDNSTSGSTDPTQTAGVTGIGPSDTSGVIGIADGGSGYGLWGLANNGFGVVGESLTGIDVGAFGTGRVQQRLQAFAGAPTSGQYLAGEQLRDINGELWICVADGAPGSWRKVAAPQLGFLGGAANFLSAPIRIFDTRSGQPAPLPSAKHSLASGSTTSIQVTGTVVGGLSVPAGALAVIGNLTVTNAQGIGDLILFPHGAARPLTSNINYVAGQNLANFAIVGLSAAGVMDLYVHGPVTDALFDVAGFIM